MEKLAIKHYMANLVKGKEIIEFYIQELLNEGITHVPRYEEDKNGRPSDVAHSLVPEASSGLRQDDDDDDEITLPHHSAFGSTVSSSSVEGRAHRGTSKKFYYLCGLLAGCGLVVALRWESAVRARFLGSLALKNA